MSTTAASFTFFNSFKKSLVDGTIDLDGHNFHILLCSSAQTLTTAVQSVYADLTEELTTANGYTLGGQALTAITLTNTAGVVKFDADNVTWTATGGSLAAFYWVLVDYTHASKPLVAFGVLDNTAGGTLVTVTDGNPLTYIVPAAGIFSLT